MKQYKFTQKKRGLNRKEIIAIVGRDALRRMVALKWQLRGIERED